MNTNLMGTTESSHSPGERLFSFSNDTENSGFSSKKEILNNAEVLKPNIALITKIDLAHIEFFGSKKEIVKQKKCIFNFLADNDIDMIPKDDECLNALVLLKGSRLCALERLTEMLTGEALNVS